MSRKTAHPRLPRPQHAALAAFIATCLGAPVQAATSFPNYPLQTGTGSVPPNILFILDDSGSMAWDFMPGAYSADADTLDAKVSPVAIGLQTYVHNTLYYNPAVTYRPWIKADGTRYTGGTSLDAVYTNNSRLSDTANLFDWSDRYRTYYLPKPTATDLTQTGNFYRYQLRYVGRQLRVVRSEYLRATSDNRGKANAGCDDVEEGKWGWRNCEFTGPTARSPAEEAQNFATWFSYHRTRSKAAKAGASEAFAGLGENFRVGYDSIWNRNGGTSVSGDLPAYGIPVGNDDGLFRGTNKSNWFDYLHRAVASSGTPLHGALQRAGEYYKTQTGSDGPWGPQTGDSQLSCRQNYAILTTDGYWNEDDGFTLVGNADGTEGSRIESADGQRSYQYSPARPYSDAVSDTLADVAMHYWKNDLRGDLANNVPTSNQDPGFWQHMVTFGISIGLKGTLDPDNDVRLIEAGDKNWPNPWRATNGGPAGWNQESNRRIDDLLHATVNSRGRFVAASDPQAFSKALTDTLAAIQRRRASGSNVASNGPSLSDGSRLYQATYTSGEWSGDVAAYSLAGGVIAGTPTWSLAAVANNDPRPFHARSVFTWDTTGGATFPTSTQLGSLARTTGPAQVTASNNANYIKGDRSLEKSRGGSLRDRASPIGDIVNSSPFYVKDTNTLYIGANDGMLHAIDASSGRVHFSYVPAGIDLAALASLSDPDYQHRFFVDGGIDVSTLEQGQGKNFLVASLGRGGKGVFALDVTAPAAFTSANVLWDRTGGSDTDMGYVLGAPLVRKGNNGKTLVVFGNGIDSGSGKAVLYIYVLSSSGTIDQTIKFDTGVSGGNGMAEPRAADLDRDGDADFIYVGDLKGNVWKIDISASNTNQWDFAFKQGASPKPLFVAKDALGNTQPITAAVALAREPVTDRVFVLFGTGRYISNGDITNTAVQSVYGLIDGSSTIGSRSDLHRRTIPYVGTDALGRPARAWEAYSALPDSARGWYVDLNNPTAGERVVTAPFVRSRALWFSSIIPKAGTGCDAGGSGYLNALDAFTGTNPMQIGGSTYTFIDVNRDGSGNDKLSGMPAQGNEGFVTSVDLGVGMPAQGTGVGNNIFVCGSDAECGGVPTPPGATNPRRLGWRELFRRD